MLDVFQKMPTGRHGFKANTAGSAQQYRRRGNQKYFRHGAHETEQDLIRTDSEYKLTKDQSKNWIDYAVTREFPPGIRDKTKSIIQDKENEKEKLAKKPRSDDEESKVGNTVDLESICASLRKKGQPKSKKSKEDSAKKTAKSPRKKTTFAPVDSKEPGRNQEEEKEIPVTAQCVIGFAIRDDRGTHTKGGFDKKVSEGLTFLREFVDPAACILPNGKDKRLGPIKTKSDLPKYQLTMRNYFNIPNQMAFSNVNKDNGGVIKGSAIMGFSLDPKTCLDKRQEI